MMVVDGCRKVYVEGALSLTTALLCRGSYIFSGRGIFIIPFNLHPTYKAFICITIGFFSFLFLLLFPAIELRNRKEITLIGLFCYIKKDKTRKRKENRFPKKIGLAIRTTNNTFPAGFWVKLLNNNNLSSSTIGALLGFKRTICLMSGKQANKESHLEDVGGRLHSVEGSERLKLWMEYSVLQEQRPDEQVSRSLIHARKTD